MINLDSLKSLRLFWTYLATNQRYSSLIVAEDVISFTRRAGNEGLTFLTTTLPLIGKALDTFHSTNVWTPPVKFKLDDEGIPIFLGRAIKLALEGQSLAVDCVRQLTLVFYKLEVDYDQGTIKRCLDQFSFIDRDIVAFKEYGLTLDHLLEDMRLLINRVLCNADPSDIRPYHGSGATADRTNNWNKWHQLRYFPKLDATFSYPDYFFFNSSHLCDDMEKLSRSPEGHPQARVCLVPKDSRGPRIISCEPTELMYIQQGLMRLLYKTIETHELTSGYINFTNQEVNRSLAKFSSIWNTHTTIDLKDASDRVSLELVRAVFPPRWVEALEACRSEETILPDGRVIKLNKFAPMGSACCFPVEALIFWACSVASIRADQLLVDRYLMYRRKQFRRSMRVKHIELVHFYPVHVYGDDIIIESVCTDAVVRGLELINLEVNKEKTFRQGPFRESCGGDYHFGMDVTPVRMRQVPSHIGTGLATNADLINLIVAKFGYESSTLLIQVIEEAVGYCYPRTELSIPCTVRLLPRASNDVFFKRRYSKRYQRFEHLVLTLHSKVLTKHPPNWGELLRKELGREIASRLPDEQHGQFSLADAHCEPGMYVATHATHKKWAWTWLG